MASLPRTASRSSASGSVEDADSDPGRGLILDPEEGSGTDPEEDPEEDPMPQPAARPAAHAASAPPPASARPPAELAPEIEIAREIEIASEIEPVIEPTPSLPPLRLEPLYQRQDGNPLSADDILAIPGNEACFDCDVRRAV